MSFNRGIDLSIRLTFQLTCRPLEHTLYPAKSTASVCLLTKDPQREYKDLLVELGIKSISRVVGVSKLKGKFKPFDVRRQLLQDHDVFLADDRITTLLPALLGKKFFDSKKWVQLA